MAKEPEKTEGKQEVTVSRGGEPQKTTPAGRALSPFEEMDRMMDMMSRMFEGFTPRGWMRPFRTEWPGWGELTAPLEARLPRVDVIDRDEDILVRAELPGVDKKDLDVSITDNMVTIRGSTRREEEEERENFYRREISSGSFARTVPLPVEVEGNKARATFKEGVLELTVPKAETSKRRRISVE